MAANKESYKIQLGLGVQPPDTVPPELYEYFAGLYRATANLNRGVSQYCGVDSQPADAWDSLVYPDTLLEGNLTRMYPIAAVTIAAGQTVNLYNDAGVLKARLAQATGLATMAHGVANTAGVIGSRFEMYWGRALLDSIGLLTIGTLYYLSAAVAGAVQNVAPSVAGQIVQPVGLALGTSTLIMNLPLNPRVV